MRTIKTIDMVLVAMFAALTAILSQLSVPLPFTPVPINLALLSVFVAGGLLGPYRGAGSQLVFVLLGAAGLPVFHNFTGGFGILAGPTGGYLIGYIAAAFVIGAITRRLPKTLIIYVLSMLAGLFACYFIGTLWFMYVTNTPLIASLGMCVIPFLPGDAFKIIVAAPLVKRLSKAIN